MGDVIPPKNTTKKEPEPDIGLPETKVDALNPGDNDSKTTATATIELSKDAWEIFNVDNLPTISDEQMERYVKHTADRRQVWIKSNINKTTFPIRMRVLVKDPVNGEEPEFQNGQNGDPLIKIKEFRYTPISIHQRQRIVTMTAELQDIQRVAQALTIIKSMGTGEGITDIKIDFKSLPETLQHEDFSTIQLKLMKKQIELNKYRFKAYFNMSEKDALCAYWGDTRDWLDVCVEKEQHVLDPQVGVM
jgi:hypothetical protein